MATEEKRYSNSVDAGDRGAPGKAATPAHRPKVSAKGAEQAKGVLLHRAGERPEMPYARGPER
ncbi:hypothetical protein [Candidatus Burkholderia verschuerenii]|uniref:hypothetical protein n=1 Tax=Candidatus Burkholderia verschuerenii TaxID=242163 RepID=UPI00067C9398|nr:hypothetical protein [Candidatus Burkholderia verschuerenii]